MRMLIAAVGKLKDDEERSIVARYAKRFDATGKSLALGPLEIIEMPEGRAASADSRKVDESTRLMKIASSADFIIALDVQGRSLTSEAFAKLLAKVRDGGAKSCALLIGGPDGHGADVLAHANLKLSLGALTLPHGLARVVLSEQLYRAATIIAGHPYHRS
ncbi:MAG: 23S rRNA (pseudouridine(1915)-N(3))-methyltransferase RlmH [Hyphomicrobium sp.]|nr:MAG: 23S rRNA (pseudouridine(1915)-N(3))-methyltransferase RlmH [Hyphomicrobium sp.]PPC98781.1 MAG: 23S rRNA (pseudouridine(1915)-N(3))-methyltransferase RlmH [Hyphomicrobium sp.]